MTLLQFPMKSLGATLERRLNQIGVYLDKFSRHRVDGTYAEDNSNKDDTYNDFAKLVNDFSSAEAASAYILTNRQKFKKLIEKYGENRFDQFDIVKFEKNFKEDFNKRNTALYSIFPFADKDDNLLREVVKYPFMIFNYGGGINAITRGVASDAVKKVHETLNTLVRNFEKASKDNTIPKDSAREIKNFLNTAEEAGVTFAVKPNLPKLKDRLDKDYETGDDIESSSSDNEDDIINEKVIVRLQNGNKFFVSVIKPYTESSKLLIAPKNGNAFAERFDRSEPNILKPPSVYDISLEFNGVKEIKFDTFLAPLDYSIVSNSEIEDLDWIMTLGSSIFRPISKFVIKLIQWLNYLKILIMKLTKKTKVFYYQIMGWSSQKNFY